MVRNLESDVGLSPISVKWGRDLLLRLDWKRLKELTRSIISAAGYRINTGFAYPDTAVDLVVAGNDSGEREDLAMIHCGPWAATEVDVKHIRRFLAHLSSQPFTNRGVYITPGVFTPRARNYAEGRDIELVDGQDLLEVIGRMPEQEADDLLKLATEEDFETPSCPTCQRKMIAHDTRVPIPWRKPKNARFRRSNIVSDDLWCRSLVVDRGAEVQFLRPVHCVEATIAGSVSGNINCRGIFTVKDGGTVTGLVGAKSMDVDEKAQFDGQLTLLNGSTAAEFPEVPKRTNWICPMESCCSGSFPPRESEQGAEEG